MIMFNESQAVPNTGAYRLGASALLISLATILGALAFEYIGGYAPCPLCLEQRYAYYAAVPLLFVALVLIEEYPRIAAVLLFAVMAAFLYNAGLGVYHAGAEWKFWPGPDTCGTDQAVPASAADLLSAIENTTVIRCDEAAIRIAGLSLAGWNVIVSLVIVGISARAAMIAITKR
jgi:disulfide bond formation protein DsbB